MSKNSDVSISCAPSFFTMLALLFIGLKLTHYIDWSWWWVLAPLYIPFFLYISILACCLIVGLVIAFFAD